MFRGFIKIFDTAAGEDTFSCILPDVGVHALQEFLDSVYQQRQIIEYHPSIHFLLTYTEKEKSVNLKTDLVETNLVKEEACEDYEDTFDAYDDDWYDKLINSTEICYQGKVEKSDDSDSEKVFLGKRKKKVRKREIKADSDAETQNGSLMGKRRKYKLREGKFKRPVLRFL